LSYKVKLRKKVILMAKNILKKIKQLPVLLEFVMQIKTIFMGRRVI